MLLNNFLSTHTNNKRTTRRAIYTGFFFKIWDNMFNTKFDGPCACALCRPVRTLQQWHETPKPDYSVLLSPHWWMTSTANTLSMDSKGNTVIE